MVEEGSLVEVGTPLAMPIKRRTKKTASDETTSTGDSELEESGALTARIAGRVSKQRGKLIVSYEEREERSYMIPPAARIIVQQGQRLQAGDRLTEGPINPQDILRIQGRERVEEYLSEEVQKVYRAQGVTIHDKHIEVVVRQMLRKVKVDATGDTELLPGHLIDRFSFEGVNAKFVAEGGEPATAQPVLLGVTKASLNTESFLAAASFQETTRVLTEAAVQGSVDHLMGPKENVIIGRLIPARSQEINEELAKPRPIPLLEPVGPDGEPLDFPPTNTDDASLLDFLRMETAPIGQPSPFDEAGAEIPGFSEVDLSEPPDSQDIPESGETEQRFFEPDED